MRATFVVTINGPSASCMIVSGLSAVRTTIIEVLGGGQRESLPPGLRDRLAELGQAGMWACHGAGDARPFWHWWCGFPEGSVSVQRVTTALPQPRGTAEPGSATAAHEAASALKDLAAEVREMAVGGGEGRLRLTLE
jgi:hypothetical protein